MNNFVVFNPTKLHFGYNVIDSLPYQLKNYGNNVLLVYGKGSIKKNGIYSKVIRLLTEANKNIFEYEGMKPNPVVDDVNAAVELGIKHDIDLVLAVGGGSVIDSAKIIAICIPEKKDPWKVMKFIEKPKSAIPLITILTLSATGTEMNQFAVLQNQETQEKIGFGSPLIYPAISFCDPFYTISVSIEYTSYGMADIIAHALEAYFGEGEAVLSDRFVAAVIKEIMEAGPLLLNDLGSYDLRARIMWASTCALNGVTFYGKKSGDWGVHDVDTSYLFYSTLHTEQPYLLFFLHG